MKRRLGLRGRFLPPNGQPLPCARPLGAVRAASAPVAAPGRSCHGPSMRRAMSTGPAMRRRPSVFVSAPSAALRTAYGRAHALPARHSRGPGPVRSRYKIATPPNAQSRFAVICSRVIAMPSSQTYMVSAADSIHLPTASSVPSGVVSLRPLYKHSATA